MAQATGVTVPVQMTEETTLSWDVRELAITSLTRSLLWRDVSHRHILLQHGKVEDTFLIHTGTYLNCHHLLPNVNHIRNTISITVFRILGLLAL